MANIKHSADDSIVFRQPKIPDGLALWRLIREAGTLDLNSTYAYLMVCRDFSETCIVAELAGRIVGFVTGYRPPQRQDTIFVWQIGVAPDTRGRGIASRVLDHLVASDACKDVRYLDTNVTPSNEASRALFRGFARRFDAPIDELEGFGSSLFPEPSHEPERLLRIGPFRPPKETP